MELAERMSLLGTESAFEVLARAKALDYVVQRVGEDVLLFASDWPHGDTAWPEAVNQVVEWQGISDTAKRKILGENALRLCSRIGEG